MVSHFEPGLALPPIGPCRAYTQNARARGVSQWRGVRLRTGLVQGMGQVQKVRQKFFTPNTLQGPRAQGGRAAGRSSVRGRGCE